jgi:hypothetical protein
MANIQTTTTSKQFRLNLSDWWKGLIMAVLVPVVGVISDSIDSGELVFDWRLIWKLAVGGLLGYLVKNLFTPSQVVIKNPELAKEVKEGDKEIQAVPK